MHFKLEANAVNWYHGQDLPVLELTCFGGTGEERDRAPVFVILKGFSMEFREKPIAEGYVQWDEGLGQKTDWVVNEMDAWLTPYDQDLFLASLLESRNMTIRLQNAEGALTLTSFRTNGIKHELNSHPICRN